MELAGVGRRPEFVERLPGADDRDLGAAKLLGPLLAAPPTRKVAVGLVRDGERRREVRLGRATCVTTRGSSSPGWTRTNNPPVNSRMLCQLSYWGRRASV
jgi:hypothetical protein